MRARTITPVLFSALLFASTGSQSLANLSGSDDFNDNVRDPSKWSIEVPRLNEVNGRLEFTSTGIGDEEGIWAWIANEGSQTRDWSVTITAVNTSTPTVSGQFCAMGLFVINSADDEDSFGILLGADGDAGRVVGSLWETDGVESDTWELLTPSTATLRISYDASTEELSCEYDTGSGYYSITSFDVSNWNMGASDTFYVAIAGLSGNSFAVSSGQAYTDNFQTSTVSDSRTIQGSKWHDVNSNAVWDAGEPGLPSWKIYSDLNGNKQWDVDEPFDVTDANGDFALVVESGQHFVAEELIANWEQTYPSGSTATGKLTLRQVIKDGVDGVDGLNEAHSVTVSPDGENVYVAGTGDDAVAVFNRNPTSGQLTYVQMLKDGVGGVDGLVGAYSVTVSPNGENVYAVGRYDDAVVVFSRNPSNGQLTYVQMLKDGMGGVDGLDGIRSVTVSPDGGNVYTASYYDDSVTVFSRNLSNGQLTYVQMLKDGVGGVNGLDGAKSVTVSPDGGHVYAAGGLDDAVAVFSRNPSNGQLTYVQMLRDGVNGVDGLNGIWTVTVSPDGEHVYTTSIFDDAVVVFSRNQSSGQLTYVQMLRDGVDGVDGLNGALSVTVSPDGRNVYATGGDDDAVAVFRRNSSNGQLTYIQMLKDGEGGVDGLDWTWSVTVSPDGGHVYAVGASDDAVAVFGSGYSASDMHQVTIDPQQVVTNINFGNVLMVVDSDGNGISDSWEILYFGSVAHCIATNDGDHDGHNNLQEFITGMDPTNAASVFMITNSSPLADDFLIEWPSVSGRIYTAFWSTNLTDGFKPMGGNIDYPQSSYTDTLHGTEAECFYRLDVRKE